MFKAFSNIMKLEKAAITPDEVAFVETPPTQTKSGVLDAYQRAIAGSRAACYEMSLNYSPGDEHAYLWATIALLAGHPEANGWMNTLQRSLARDRRFYLETVARKWYNLHKEDFARTKAARQEDVRRDREAGLKGADPNFW